jgi:hypothetical protein
MRSLVLAVVVALSASSAFAQDAATELRRGDNDRRGPHRPVGVQVAVDREEMTARMERLERLLDEAYERSERDRGNGERGNRKQLRRALEELEDMQRVLANAPDVRVLQPPPPPPPAPTPVVQPIGEGKLQRITEAMAREGFPREKLTVLRDASQHHHFLIAQIRPLLEQFSFANDRLEAVRILWPRVLDRDNAFQLYEAFPFASDKQKLRAILNS